jgi:LacI family transcriptional regulator
VGRDLKRRVEKAMRQLEFRPNHVARSLRTRQTRTLGMVISDLTNPFFPEMVRGAEAAAREQGYMLVTFNTDDDAARERQAIHTLQMRRLDGALLVPALPRSGLAHVKALITGGTPVVFLDRAPRAIAADSVMVDNKAGARDGVRHLIEQGARTIGYIGGSRTMYVSRERLEGYRAGLREARIPFDLSLAVEGDFRQESGYKGALRLLAGSRRPDAIFSANILMTLGVLRALEETGLSAPRDVLLATFDHVALLDSFRPRLTSVAQPAHRIGFEGAKLLIERIESGPRSGKPRCLVLPAELRLGESSRRLLPAAGEGPRGVQPETV